MSQFCYLVPVVSQTINGQSVNVPKYFGTDFTGNFTSVPYGREPITLLTLPRASSALQQESDIYTFNPDLTVPMSDEDAAILDGFLTRNNLPSDGIVSGLPFVTALVYVLQLHLCVQHIAGATGSSIFAASAVTLATIASSVPALSAVAASAISSPFNFRAIADTVTVGEFLHVVSRTWTGGPISLGGF
jgi:hypothetical protein